MTTLSENLVGFEKTYVHKASYTIKRPLFAAGTRVTCNDGVYQFAKAGGAVAADASDVAIDTDFIATTGGAGTFDNASGVALVTGDMAWFKIQD